MSDGGGSFGRSVSRVTTGARARTRTWVRAAFCIGITLTAVPLVATAGGDARRGAGGGKHGGAADTVLKKGFVYTVDRKNDVARAVAIDHGKLVYVGNNKGARRFIGAKTDVINLRGRMVMPGLHEGHIHEVINSDQETCDLEAEPLTVPEFQARVQACLDDPDLHTAEPGSPNDFLNVENLYMQFLRPAGTAPHKSMLDALRTDRPITVSAAVTGHTTLVNQNALDLAGITRDTPDPPGGRIDHDPNGEPNGLLQDAAADLVFEHQPPPPPVPPQRQVELAGERMQEFSEEGITSFFVPGAPADPETIQTFNTLQDQGGLTARAHFALPAEFEDVSNPAQLYSRIEQERSDLEHENEISRPVRSWRPGKQGGRRLVPKPGVSIDAVKFFLDGIAQFPGQTAAMTEPYLENIGTVENPVYAPRTDPAARGELLHDAAQLGPIVSELERRGFQSHVHAIGDQAVRTALDAFKMARKENGRRLERAAHESMAHTEVVHPDDYKRFGKEGVTTAMGLQWAKPAPDSTEAVKPYMSGNRWDLYEPTVPITKGGGRVSLGSDCCLDPFDEWFDLEVAILREADWGPEFPQFEGKLNALPGLSVRQGIRAVTINGAYQMHQQKITGSLKKGKLADLVVLNQNITKVPKEEIGNTDVLMTLVGGKKVWVAPGFE
jgi:predicted amidohydrolase YtcJ